MPDINERAYVELCGNKNWRERYLNDHVGLVNGRMVTSGSRDSVLKELRRRFPNDTKFIRQVTESEEIISQYSSMQ